MLQLTFDELIPRHQFPFQLRYIFPQMRMHMTFTRLHMVSHILPQKANFLRHRGWEPFPEGGTRYCETKIADIRCGGWRIRSCFVDQNFVIHGSQHVWNFCSKDFIHTWMSTKPWRIQNVLLYVIDPHPHRRAISLEYAMDLLCEYSAKAGVILISIVPVYSIQKRNLKMTLGIVFQILIFENESKCNVHGKINAQKICLRD